MSLRAGCIAALGLLGLASLSACASAPAAPLGDFPPPPVGAYGPPPPPSYIPPPASYAQPPLAPQAVLPPGLLPAPPANAGPGECFAKVVVPGQPIPRPPPQPRAVWVFTPAPPGGTPMWCLYFEPGVAPPPIFTPERLGWIRVICDAQATTAQIRHVQRRLQAWGVYQGPFDGRLDRRTLDGVRAFQERRRIRHGGYLSVETLAALDEAPSAGPGYGSYAPPPVYGPPPAAYPQAPVVIPPPPCAPNACLPPDRGAPPYSRWLSWSGKSTY